MTARTSALLFAAALGAPALTKKAAWASRPLYLAFMVAHAAHFTVVARYAMATGGRNLFPGGRSMTDVGGWPTVLGIDALFSGLALTGWAAGTPAAGRAGRTRAAGRAATTLIGAMFVGTYLGQLTRSAWSAVPATAVAGAVVADLVAGGRRRAGRFSRLVVGGAGCAA